MKPKKTRKSILPGLVKAKKKKSSTCGCGKHKK